MSWTIIAITVCILIVVWHVGNKRKPQLGVTVAPHIVKFKDGRYGVRRTYVVDLGYRKVLAKEQFLIPAGAGKSVMWREKGSAASHAHVAHADAAKRLIRAEEMEARYMREEAEARELRGDLGERVKGEKR